jgi:hypothetical protein
MRAEAEFLLDPRQYWPATPDLLAGDVPAGFFGTERCRAVAGIVAPFAPARIGLVFPGNHSGLSWFSRRCSGSRPRPDCQDDASFNVHIVSCAQRPSPPGDAPQRRQPAAAGARIEP